MEASIGLSLHWGVLMLLYPLPALRFGLKPQLMIFQGKWVIPDWCLTCLVFAIGMQTDALQCMRKLLISMISFRR